jgi:dTDP-glucose pyrophosphorylase
MIAAGTFTLFLSTASEAFQLLLSVGAGTGLIYLLRWFWWRINAWSEISAMASSFAISIAFFVAKKMGVDIPDPIPLLTTVGVTTVVWITVTLMTSPADHATLMRFYELTRPSGPGWKAIRAESKIAASPDSLPQMMLGWTSGVMFVYAGLFGTGSLIYGRTLQASIWFAAFVLSGIVLWQVVRRIWTADEPRQRGSETSAIAAALPCTKAVILARGLGTRMRKEDSSIALSPEQEAAAAAGAKGMMPFGRPFLDYVLSAAADAGFTDVCLVVAPDHAEMRDYYTNRVRPKRVNVSFAVQSVAIGTADAVLAAEEFTAGEPFVVLNADNYYPAAVLQALRNAQGPATVGFSRAGLLRDGNISADRIAAYAILDVGNDGLLKAVREKPSAATIEALGDNVSVSMNCWRLTSEFYRACRDVQPSPRGELELPLAVQYAIDILGMSFTVIPVDAMVLDLSQRADIPSVAAQLKALEVSI